VTPSSSQALDDKAAAEPSAEPSAESAGRDAEEKSDEKEEEVVCEHTVDLRDDAKWSLRAEKTFASALAASAKQLET
jgi:hypothetical protein